MQQLEEKDSSPLEDAEITRLIKVSRELGYKKQDKIPERNLVDFKPTSITQIAASSDDQKDNENKESINRSFENIHLIMITTNFIYIEQSFFCINLTKILWFSFIIPI